MSDEDDHDRERAKLRLASARRRAHFFLREIQTLEGADFPHPDAKEALADVKKHFIQILLDSEGLDSASFRTIKEVSLNIGVALDSYTPVLGFILRSTNVRNAFELHYPLRRLVERIIGSHARLVISSEWDFIPFTYPMNLDVLPDYVLVGGPATESSSALIVPLAGHEIGHSAWYHYDVTSALEDKFTAALEKSVANTPDAKTALEEDLGPDYEGFLRDTGFKQIEETFCDCFALFVFGDAYAFAFEYFMFPGGSTRLLDYPPEEYRIRYMQEAAAWRGIKLAPGVFQGWSASPDAPDSNEFVTAVLDQAMEATLPDIFEAVGKIIDGANIEPPDSSVVTAIRQAFNKGIPYNEPAKLSEIVIAGWHRIRAEGGWSEPSTIKLAFTLNEIMLKTIEVSEYQRRVRKC